MSGPPTAEEQGSSTPTSALQRLREGNERFVSDRPLQRANGSERAAVAGGQHPIAVVVGCIDSRVPPERVFDAALGELFACRTAGTVVDHDVVGGVEFACAAVGAPLVVVLGHTACGAVAGACDGVELGLLTQLLDRIRPAVVTVTGGDPTPGADDAELVDRVVEANVWHQRSVLLADSEVLSALVEDGTIAVVGAVYDLASGGVRWLDPRPGG